MTWQVESTPDLDADSTTTMITLTTASLLFTAILLVAAIPVLIVARRDGLSDTIRHFLIGAGVIGLLCGIGSATSEQLVDRCLDAGGSSSACIDAGSVGFQLLLVSGYVMTALTRAYLIYND